MIYRRFGKTELPMPVFSCGGMRYLESWQDLPRDQITAAVQDNVERIVRTALAHGINHIETARGYGTSEVQLGGVLPHLPREPMIVQTKVSPQPDGEAFRRVFETSLTNLRLDYVDLLGIHGLNTPELLHLALKPGGSLEAARRIQSEGLARHIGFSTHGPLELILETIASDGFDYVNLHWYWADQLNAPAIEAAAQRDMGVFIISPSDKGGRLYDPPAKLVDLCRPLTPMAFNDLWCLRNQQVHTLSIGAARPTDFDAHLAALEWVGRQDQILPDIEARLRAEAERVLGADWLDHWHRDLPPVEAVPGGVNLYHVLRLYTLAKAYDMVGYGRFRYNLFGSGGHWFPGHKVDQIDWRALPAVIKDSPVAARIPAVLKAAHEMLNAEDKKRLSQGG